MRTFPKKVAETTYREDTMMKSTNGIGPFSPMKRPSHWMPHRIPPRTASAISGIPCGIILDFAHAAPNPERIARINPRKNEASPGDRARI